jgi:hypothetical protein
MGIASAIVKLWEKKIEIARRHREKVFDPVANKIARYYHTNRMYQFPVLNEDPDEEPFRTGRPYHKISVALTGQFVRVMLPFLTEDVPRRVVSPRGPQVSADLKRLMYSMASGMDPTQMAAVPFPEDQWITTGRIQSLLGGHLLNYAADDGTFNLRNEKRQAIQQALVHGRGILWHELIDTPDGTLPGSFFENQANILLDPDFDNIRDAGFAVRMVRRPIWWIAENFKIPVDQLKAAAKSYAASAIQDTEPWRSDDDCKDVGVYYEVFSRQGLGNRFSYDHDELKEAVPAMEAAGPNVYLAIVPGMEYPLNMHPDQMVGASEEEIKQRLSWPIALWARQECPWPFTNIDFYPDGLWPKPPLEDALPLQSFLDFAYFFLMQSIKISSSNIHITDSAVSRKLQQAFDEMVHNTIVELDERYPDLAQLVHTLELGKFNPDLLTTINIVEQKWREFTGINDLILGGVPDKMMRSSAEAQLRQSNGMIRPDDMANCVKSFDGSVARAELAAQRLTIRKDVARYFGEDPNAQISGMYTDAWMRYMATDDPWAANSELAVTVEGGAGRRRNLATLLADLSDSMQVILPLLTQQYATDGDPSNINTFFAKWAEAHQAPELAFEFPDKRQEMAMQQQQMQMQQQAQAQGAVPEQQEQEAPMEGGQMMQPSEEEMMAMMQQQQQQMMGEQQQWPPT